MSNRIPSLKDFEIEEDGEHVYVNATYTDEHGHVFKGHIACLSDWPLIGAHGQVTLGDGIVTAIAGRIAYRLEHGT